MIRIIIIYQTRISQTKCERWNDRRTIIRCIASQDFFRAAKRYLQAKKYLQENTKAMQEKIQEIEDSEKNIATNKQGKNIIKQCQVIIQDYRKIVNALKVLERYMKSLMMRYIVIQTNLYFILQLLILIKEVQELVEKLKRYPKLNHNICTNDYEEIKKSMYEEIKNYFIFNNQIPNGIINFTMPPINTALAKEFIGASGKMVKTDLHVAQYQRSLASKESYFLSQKKKNAIVTMAILSMKLLAKNPTPEMLQTYKENMLSAFNVAAWEKSFSEIETSLNYLSIMAKTWHHK
ncbi:hypothetical protein RFI_21716 [Reticulomyxa filosa]|uniref:Uncharacterized protein n=1 Tax=Reticulomyxa filosa TaxID=46433 RepID=X6MQD0_RETFI|nr:hypothetical protein RFI_21716 [Reticulomyxa filosa]|eukprot:ETO15647.1 hypothetical protein RFI_21716 [Reticulomyxa filosa]